MVGTTWASHSSSSGVAKVEAATIWSHEMVPSANPARSFGSSSSARATRTHVRAVPSDRCSRIASHGAMPVQPSTRQSSAASKAATTDSISALVAHESADSCSIACARDSPEQWS